MWHWVSPWQFAAVGLDEGRTSKGIKDGVRRRAVAWQRAHSVAFLTGFARGGGAYYASVECAHVRAPLLQDLTAAAWYFGTLSTFPHKLTKCEMKPNSISKPDQACWAWARLQISG